MNKKANPIDLFEQALAECKPKWAIFEDRELRFFEWAWEFLRRNPDYIYSFALHQKREQEAAEHFENFQRKQKSNKIIAQMPIEYGLKAMDQHIAMSILAAARFGLRVFVDPEVNMPDDSIWDYELAAKRHAEFQLLEAYDQNQRLIYKPIQLTPKQEVMIIDTDSPKEAYYREINRIYARCKTNLKTRMSIGRDIKKYPAYIKAYDLYMWGMQDHRAIEKKGKRESCIQLKYIADYLHSQKSPEDNSRKLVDGGVISHINTAKGMTHGGYKELLKVKGTI